MPNFWDSWERDIGGYTVNPLDILGGVSGIEDIVGGAQTGDYTRMALGGLGFIPGIGMAGRALTLAAKGARGIKATQPLLAAARSGGAAARVAPVAVVKPGLIKRGMTTYGKLNAPMLPKRIIPTLAKTRTGRFVTAASRPDTLMTVSQLALAARNMSAPTGSGGTVLAAPGARQQEARSSTGGQQQAGTVYGGTTPDAATVTTGSSGAGYYGGSGTAGTAGTGPTGGQGGSGTSTRGKVYGGMSPESEAPPVNVQLAESDYAAALARSAAAGQANDAALRDLFSQKAMAAQGSAADVYGGRSRAILGQALTGARRGYVSGAVQEQSRALQERSDIKTAYDEAIRRAYAAAAEQQRQRAAQRAAMATQITGIGV